MMETSLNGSEALTKFYQSKFYFSYSGLNKLLYSPAMFYSHYVLNEREDRTDAHLVGGRVLHCLLFEPDTYDDNFTSLPGKLPTDSQRKIIDIIFKKYLEIKNDSLTLEDYSQDILTQLLYANLYQSLKDTKDGTGDEKRLKKILTEENKDYFEFLKQSENRTVVDSPTLASCKVQVEILRNNSDVRALLQLDKTKEDTHITVYNDNIVIMSRNDATIWRYDNNGNEIVSIATNNVTGQGPVLIDFGTTGFNIDDRSVNIFFNPYRKIVLLCSGCGSKQREKRQLFCNFRHFFLMFRLPQGMWDRCLCPVKDPDVVQIL